MKKIFLFLSLIVTLVLIFSVNVSADNSISVYCNGSLIPFEDGPYTVNGVTMVSIKDMGNALGYECIWDEANKTVVMASPVFCAWVQIDNPVIPVSKNDVMEKYTASVAPCVIGGRVYVPVRTIVDIYQGNVYWNSATNTVGIVTSSYDGSYRSSQTDITISGFVPPQTLTLGMPYILSGTIHSAVPLNRVNIKVLDNTTMATEINETQFDIQTLSYALSDIDSRVTFGKVSKGEKTLRITCVDAYEGRVEFNYVFNISHPHGVPITTPLQGNMLWPVPSSGLITTIFWCDNVLCHSNAGRINGHAALDIAANENAPVIAVMAGVVEDQGFGSHENSQTGYGNFVRIDHGNGLKTQYSHLYSINVTTGQYVNAGDIIGGVGNTGNSTGNHLDFYISQNGVRCDPLYYLDIPANARCYEPCDVPYFNEALASRGIVR